MAKRKMTKGQIRVIKKLPNSEQQCTNKDVQSRHKTKVREKRTQLKTGVNSGAIEGSAVSAPQVAPVVLI